MSKISSYSQVAAAGLTDMLIGIDTYTNDTNISDTGRKIKILNILIMIKNIFYCLN